MKQIAKFDELLERNVTAADHPEVSIAMLRAYWLSKNKQAEYVDFGECLCDAAIEQIVQECRDAGIDRITISSGFSSMPTTIWRFIECGCELTGMMKVPADYMDGEFGEELRRPMIPAFVIKIN